MFFGKNKKDSAAPKQEPPAQAQSEQPRPQPAQDAGSWQLPPLLEKHRDFLESTLRPANLITFTAGAAKPWESKLGGCPYLEDADQYPRDAKGRPMMFFAQINLEKMPPLPDFPTKGILQFYVEDDDLYGLDEPCVIRYVPDYHKDEGRLLKENPYRAGYQGDEPFSTDCRIAFTQKHLPVGTECGIFQERFEGKVSEEEWDKLYDVCDASGSKVGGYPYFVQHAPAYYDDGDADVLLLQLDIDDAIELMFGDSGNCTFLISREDLLKLDFSKVEYDWQCC